MVTVVPAAEFKQAAEAHAVERHQVNLDAVLERCNKALNDKIKAFRLNKGLNEIALQVKVQYMLHEFSVIDEVIRELEKAGYAVKKEEVDCRDEDQYWLKIFVS